MPKSRHEGGRLGRREVRRRGRGLALNRGGAERLEVDGVERLPVEGAHAVDHPVAQTRPEMLLGHGRPRGHADCPIIVTFGYTGAEGGAGGARSEGGQRPRPATRHGCAVEAARAIVRARILHHARESHIGEHGDFYRFVTWVKLLPFLIEIQG